MTELLAARYRRFATQEARGHSRLYETLALGCADDPAVLAFLLSVPAEKQQPNLLFAAVRVVCGTAGGFREFRQFLLSHHRQVRDVMLRRRTQTNEPARCAVLLPLLAALPQPLALIEVGASAGLCLLPDRYGYDYGDIALLGSPLLRCRPNAACPLPDRKPEIAWRVGLDLDPVDLTDPAEVAWLEALVWPDQPERLHRLRQAIEAARADPPRVVQGDLRHDTGHLVAEASRRGTVVVFHTAVLAYLSDVAERVAFGRRVQDAGAIWISNEAPGVFPAVAARVGRPGPSGAFLLARNAEPVAWTDPHGGWIDWIG
jgi:hypothetical protein